MERKAPGRDPLLSAAIVVAMLLLVALYLGALALPLWLHSAHLLPLLWALVSDAVILGLFGFQYRSLDWAALRASRARFVSAAEAPMLHAVVERLCGVAALPKPRLAVVDTDIPDAFAAGRNPARSTIAITRGLVARLEPAEIEGVIAHELAHVANRDGAVMTVASFPALSLREGLSEAPWRVWIFGLPLMLVACLAYAFSAALMLTVSLCREYSADRGAAIITGAPEQLMSALQKIAGAMPEIPEEDLRRVASMTAFFIVPPRLRSLTHPPLERRLERLSAMSRELGTPAIPASIAAPEPSRGSRLNPLLGAATFVVVFAFVVVVGTVVR
jgi:heat shock protein HtpX